MSSLKKKKLKCYICKKKIIFPLLCNCNNYFCTKHKYPSHNCEITKRKHKENLIQNILKGKCIPNKHNYTPIH